MRHKHNWRKQWSPMGNGTSTMLRYCQEMGCDERQFVVLDFTDLEAVQLKRGGFKLVRVPGKAYSEIMAAFTDEKRALWYVAVKIAFATFAVDYYGSSEFFSLWSHSILWGE